MDDEDSALKFGDPNLGLLRGSSVDLTEMSDEFLDMLNTENRSEGIDDFNTWFRDNIAPERPPPTNSILDSLAEGDAFSEEPSDAFVQQGDNANSQFYPTYALQTGSDVMDVAVSPYNSPESNFSYPSPTQSDAFLSSPQQSREAFLSSPQQLQPQQQRQQQRQQEQLQQHETFVSSPPQQPPRETFASSPPQQPPKREAFLPSPQQQEAPEGGEYYVKETYFQDEAGNTFVEQEYVRRGKGVRVVPVSPPKQREFTPQRTVIRSVRGNPPYPKKGENPQSLRRIKAARAGLANSKQEPRTVLVSPPGGYTSPPRLVYLSNEVPVIREESTTPEELCSPAQLKDERLSPSSASTVITAWEQTIKQPPSVAFSRIQPKNSSPPKPTGPPDRFKQQLASPPKPALPLGHKRVVRVGPNGAPATKISPVPQVKHEIQPRIAHRVAPVKDINHIAIVGKPGLVNLKSGEAPASIKIYKPVNSTKPILKPTTTANPKVSVKGGVEQRPPLLGVKGGVEQRAPLLGVKVPGGAVEEEEEPEEKKSNHNAVERKYRYSINDKIMELKAMLVPKDTKIQKSGVLRRAIEHINNLQSTIEKLKYDNVQLKKKQDILEQNNRVLTMKLTEQGASVVYLEKTPDLIEPTGPYSELEGAGDTGSKGYYTTPHSTNIYQHLPDSPESLRLSDGERGHVRSNSGSSGGYSSSDDLHCGKKQRYNVPQSHRDQRTIPMLCMVFMFGLFLPSFLPQQAIASSSIGRTLLSVSNSNDYIFPALYLAKWGLGLLLSTTLAYLFFVVKSKVTIKEEGVIRKHFQLVKQAIKNGNECTAQVDLEQLLCSLGVRVYHNTLSYYLLVCEYMLSILPHNKIVHWLCSNNSSLLSEMLLYLAQMQHSQKYKQYEGFSGLCYALQSSRYSITNTSTYIALALTVTSPTLKAHFYRRGRRRDSRWIGQARDFILGYNLSEIPIGVSVSEYVELEYTRNTVARAVRAVVLSDESSARREQAAESLLKDVQPSLSALKAQKNHSAAVRELHWMVSVLRTYKASQDEQTTPQLKLSQDASEVVRAITGAYRAAEEGEEGEEGAERQVSGLIDQFCSLTADPLPVHHSAILCVGVEWLFKAQIDGWLARGTANLNQKTNFKRTLQLLETLGGAESYYKVSLYTAIHRVMCGANPVITRKHLSKILGPATRHESVYNHEQVLAIDVCMKYVPSLLSPGKEQLLEHMHVFLRSQD